MIPINLVGSSSSLTASESRRLLLCPLPPRGRGQRLLLSKHSRVRGLFAKEQNKRHMTKRPPSPNLCLLPLVLSPLPRGGEGAKMSAVGHDCGALLVFLTQ